MATGFGGLVDAVAFGALNEVLGEIRGKDGMSRPHRYEVTLFPPSGSRGSIGLGDYDDGHIAPRYNFRMIGDTEYY